MSIQKGVKVTIIDGHAASETHQHGFKKGQVVTCTGVKYKPHHLGQWVQFEDDTGFTQYLLAEHYELVGSKVEKATPERVSGEIPEKVVDKTLPTKAVYVVVKADGCIRYSGEDRDTAREIKSILGGKKAGVRIFSYTADKEIR